MYSFQIGHLVHPTILGTHLPHPPLHHTVRVLELELQKSNCQIFVVLVKLVSLLNHPSQGMHRYLISLGQKTKEFTVDIQVFQVLQEATTHMPKSIEFLTTI